MLNLNRYASILYADRLCINRYVEVENEDGTAGKVLDESQELKDIPCHVSSVKQDERDLVNWDVDEVVAKVKIFLSPSVKIHKGDEVTVEKHLNGVVVRRYKGFAGDPMLYDLSQEFVLLEKRVKDDVF